VTCLGGETFFKIEFSAPPATHCLQHVIAMPLSPQSDALQVEAMHRVLKLAAARAQLTGATLIIELVAIRILELACAGEFDADKVTEKVLAEFEL
jgi:hypothetical protein